MWGYEGDDKDERDGIDGIDDIDDIDDKDESDDKDDKDADDAPTAATTATTVARARASRILLSDPPFSLSKKRRSEGRTELGRLSRGSNRGTGQQNFCCPTLPSLSLITDAPRVGQNSDGVAGGVAVAQASRISVV